MHSRPVFPSVFLSIDAVRADTRKLMGRQSAGTGFLRGLSQAYAGDSRALTLIHGGGASQPVLEQEVRRAGWRGAIAHRSSRQPASWTDSPVLYYPAPIDVHLAWQRSRAGTEVIQSGHLQRHSLKTHTGKIQKVRLCRRT